ncbi:hypothetical protein BDK51DRAFT_31372, partial [Blyttiomyces helicus]
MPSFPPLDKIDIPLGTSEGEVLEVDLQDDDLKNNFSAILEILVQEEAPLRLFLDFAFEFHKRGLNLEFEKFLHAGERVADSNPRNAHQDFHKNLLYTSLASYYIEVGKTLLVDSLFKYPDVPEVPDKDFDRPYVPRSQKALFDAATQLINKATQNDPLTLVTKGNFYLAKGDVTEAMKLFKSASRLDANCVPALVGEAALLFKSGDYKTALSHYQRVLLIEPDLPDDVRVPIGLCFHRLGMIAEAKRAFERALERNGQNVDALILLSNIETNEAHGLQVQGETSALILQANKRVVTAFNVNKKHPSALLLTGNFLFSKKRYDQ